MDIHEMNTAFFTIATESLDKAQGMARVVLGVNNNGDLTVNLNNIHPTEVEEFLTAALAVVKLNKPTEVKLDKIEIKDPEDRTHIN